MSDSINHPAIFPDLEGASAFITGGGSGIGANLTEGFLRQGAKVAFVQRSDAGGFCDEVEAVTGTRPLFLPCDITNVPALRAAIAEAEGAHGPITILVNNAANDMRHKAEEVTEEFWDSSQAINLKAYSSRARRWSPACAPLEAVPSSTSRRSAT
jgi:NAD(P)-dependent dehydrogenase (short-subunit alcohol dehydrogenase family)